MSGAPTPEEVFHRAAEEGERRLDQSVIQLVATSFTAGFTVVFGIVALGIVHGTVQAEFGPVARVAGALAFAPGVVFLVVGRTELFNENFLDPVATAFDRSNAWLVGALLRLWTLTLVFNLVGGLLFAVVFAVDGVLPPGTAHALGTVAEEIARQSSLAAFASGIVGGALVALLSYLLQAVDSDFGRITASFLVGFLLALGPFAHVVVTALHLVFGVLFGTAVGLETAATTAGVVTAGNLVGGLGLVTLSHVVQVVGAGASD